jgi:hypothetical protein
MKPTTAALAVLLVALCACSSRDSVARKSGAASEVITTAALTLPEPLPADLLPPAPPDETRTEPAPPPSAEEVAAFNAPVPK